VTPDSITAEVAELIFGKKERAIHRTMNSSCVAVLLEGGKLTMRMSFMMREVRRGGLGFGGRMMTGMD
jgi:hypothetical protein